MKDMKELKHVDVLSVAKISAIWMALMSIVMILLGSVLQVMVADYVAEPFMAELTIPGIIFGVLFYLIFGFLCGALSAWLYNVIAKLVGGIKYKVK